MGMSLPYVSLPSPRTSAACDQGAVTSWQRAGPAMRALLNSWSHVLADLPSATTSPVADGEIFSPSSAGEPHSHMAKGVAAGTVEEMEP